MAEPENSIIHHLQEIRSDIDGIRSEMKEMRTEMETRFDGVETQISGINHLMTLLAAHYHNLDERVETLEQRC